MVAGVVVYKSANNQAKNLWTDVSQSSWTVCLAVHKIINKVIGISAVLF